MKVLEMSVEPVSVSGRCDYPTRSRGMGMETAQLEGEVLGALEWLMGIEEAYAREKNFAGTVSNRAMSKLHINYYLFVYDIEF